MVAPTLGWETIVTPAGKLEVKAKQADSQPTTGLSDFGWEMRHPALETCAISPGCLDWGLYVPYSVRRLDLQRGDGCTWCRSRQVVTGAAAWSRPMLGWRHRSRRAGDISLPQDPLVEKSSEQT